LSFSPEQLQAGGGGGLFITVVNLHWLYGGGGGLGRLKREGFTGGDGRLSQTLPLSPQKIGFLSPEIRIPLPRGSAGKTRRPPGPTRSWRLAAQGPRGSSSRPTFDLLGPAAVLIPHRGGRGGGFSPLGVRLSARLQVSV